jgi:hypothetical protein
MLYIYLVQPGSYDMPKRYCLIHGKHDVIIYLFIYLLIHNAWNLKVMAFKHDVNTRQQPRFSASTRRTVYRQPAEALVLARDLFSFVLLWGYWCTFCLCFLLCVYIDLRWRTTVSWYIVRLAACQRSYF